VVFEVSLGVAMLTVVVVSLVGVLMLARRQLVATGDVIITVNGDAEKALQTSAGSTLLGTLADNQIFIPSARQASRRASFSSLGMPLTASSIRWMK